MKATNPVYRLIQKNMAHFKVRKQPPGGLKHAAVALVVSGRHLTEGAITLTRRPNQLKTHRGQWALPGGRIDAGETIINAALRELHEEIGLNLSEGAILGLLDDYTTHAGFLITPVVIWGGEAPEFKANPAEVASVHQVSFDELNSKDLPELYHIEESSRPVIRMRVGDRYIHARTDVPVPGSLPARKNDPGQRIGTAAIRLKKIAMAIHRVL